MQEAVKGGLPYSLNNYIMASFSLDSHPELPKSDPTSAV
jgi:hypothetical protein